ncbi:MAG: RMD1 family protein [Gammaproteobacteria bacterium]
MSQDTTRTLFPTPGQVLKCRAMYLGQRIDVKQFRYTQYLAANPLAINYGHEGIVVLFRYGVAVMYGLTALEENRLQQELAPYIRDPLAAIEEESLDIRLDQETDGFVEGKLCLSDMSVQRLQLVAGILAKSVVLAYYEKTVGKTFDHVEPLAEQLRHKGRGGTGNKVLLQRIGEIMAIQSKMVGRVEVSDKPELLWEYPMLERLYQRMEDEYEIKERHVALERKLQVISRATETILDLLQYNRSHRVEWYIVILILIEIVITLAEKLG